MPRESSDQSAVSSTAIEDHDVSCDIIPLGCYLLNHRSDETIYVEKELLETVMEDVTDSVVQVLLQHCQRCVIVMYVFSR